MLGMPLNISRLNDPNSLENGLVLTAATSALTLVDPRRIGVGGRIAYRGALAGITGWTMWTAVRAEHDLLMPFSAKIGVVTSGVGLVLAFTEAGEALDGKLHDALVRAGVRRPRLAMAAASAILGFAAWWEGRHESQPFVELVGDDVVDGEGETYAEDETVDLPEDVHALVAALLEKTDAYGAPELREQLTQARALLSNGEIEDAFYPGIGFEVPRELPRAVPGDCAFPVIGRYRPIDGRTFDVRLSTQMGRLSSLYIYTGSDWSDEENFEWDMSGRSLQEIPDWPTPDELEFLIETPNGLIPT
ncbi:MAG: hypothetical protein QM705_10370 [Ancrocorticia sp.]